MSEQNEEEIQLAHIDYVESVGIDVNTLPAEIESKMDAIDKLIDEYEADPTDEKEASIVSQSSALKGEIENWYNVEQKKIADAKAASSAPAEPTPAEPIVTPAATAVADEEDSEWGTTGDW